MNKYTEWIDLLSEKERQHEIIWRELYTKIGCIIHNSQLLEYDLCVLLIYNQTYQKIKNSDSITMSYLDDLDNEADRFYEKLKKMTMGQVASNIDSIKELNDNHKKEIKSIIKTRNDIVHNIFKDRLKDNWFKKHENIDALINEYDSFVRKIIEENKSILKMIKLLKSNVMKLF